MPTQEENSQTPAATGYAKYFYKYVPAIESLRQYSANAFFADLSAGITVAAVAVPQAMAYATLAGLPPQYGLYTAIVMTAVGALLDSSKQLINGPTNAISVALLSALAVVPEPDRVSAAILITFLVGILQLGIVVLRLGDLSRFVSHAVILGFTVGASTLLLLDQSKHLLGLKSQGRPEDHFLERFYQTMLHGGAVNLVTLAIGLGTIGVVLAVRHFNDFCRRRGARFPIPQHLVAVALAAICVWAFQLDRRFNVAIVGPVPGNLPGFQAPEFRWDRARLLAGNALALAMLGLLEAIAMAKAIAHKSGQRLDIHQQCLSEGAANLAGSFFQCMPGSGSLTRSAVNHQAGAVSQWSGVVSAVFVAAIMLVFAPFAQYIPRAALAGLLMLAGFRMVDFAQIGFHFRATRFDAGVVLATAFAAVFISVEFCILVGVFLSFTLYVPRAATIQLGRLIRTSSQQLRELQPYEKPCERILLYHLDGELFFGAEPEFDRHFREMEANIGPKTKVVLLVLKRARNHDAVFLKALAKFHHHCAQQEVTLVLAGIRLELYQSLVSTGLCELLEDRHIFGRHRGNTGEIDDAIDWAYEQLANDYCSDCPFRSKPGDRTQPLNYSI